MTFVVHPLRPHMPRINFDPTDEARRIRVPASFVVTPVQFTDEGQAHLAVFHDMEACGQRTRITSEFAYTLRD
jgi:hypothetical protein